MTTHTSSTTGPAAGNDGYHVAVTGRRLEALSAAVVLDGAGHTVTREASSDTTPSDLADAVTMTPDLAAVLVEYDVVDPRSVSTPATETRYLAPDGALESSFAIDRHVTSPDTLASHLRAALPDDAPVTDVAPDAADVHVAADGWLSGVRQRLQPTVTPDYAGYVRWHGTVSERELPPQFVARFVDRLTLSRGPNDLLAAMVLPGPDGATEQDGRRVHWQWYRPLAPRELGSVLTDRTGHNHDRAVDPGALQPRYTAALHDHAADHAPALTRLVRTTPDPGVEPVVDLAVSEAVVDTTVLVGEAAFATRQHVGTSRTRGVRDAAALAAALDRYDDLRPALADWQTTQELDGRQLVEQGRQTDLDRLLGEV